MCMYFSKRPYCQTAKKGFWVYKWFTSDWRTPFRGMQMQRGKLYRIKKGQRPDIEERALRGGMFHAYPSEVSARSAGLFDGWILVACWVPKGAKFMRGHSVFRDPQIAVSALRPKIPMMRG